VHDDLACADGQLKRVQWEAHPWSDASGAEIQGVVIFSQVLQKSSAHDDRSRGNLIETSLQAERTRRMRLEALRQSALAISLLEVTQAENLIELLELIAEKARALTHADYSAVGVGTDPERPFEPWVTSGISQKEVDAVGRAPRPIGLLGQIARGQLPLRLTSLSGAPGAVGLPPNHPPLGPLLGVPIALHGSALGNFYLARRPGAPPFEDDDQTIIELLASHAAIAIHNAKLFGKTFADMRARDEALAVVSHDLTNPLNAIALREQQLARSGDAVAASHAHTVSRSVDEMRRMIRGLLDAVRLDSGRLALECQPTKVCELIQDIVETTAPLAHDREVSVEVDADTPHPVLLDRDRFGRVLANVIGNALKFTPNGGRIVVYARQNADSLNIRVADTGVGIAPAELPHIFERYYTSGQQRGTGLGLYIAKGLVEAHRGKIWVESQLGVGTVVHIRVPTPPAGVSPALPVVATAPNDT
jgi:signal transduction histidine kinase